LGTVSFDLERKTLHSKEVTMSPMKRYAKRQAKTLKRRRLKARERIRQQRADAQRYIEAIHQALEDLGFPDTLVAEIEGRLQAQQQLLGKIVGLRFPTLFGARHPHELTRVRGWDKNVPSKLLGALPKKSWLKRLRRLGLEMLLGIWRHPQTPSASTQSRWQWRWVADDSVFRKYGRHFRLVGRWWSGQFSATRPCGSKGIGGGNDSMKLCVSSSGCETRPAKGEPACAGSKPCDGVRNGLGDA
jgi:hypothetical protein